MINRNSYFIFIKLLAIIIEYAHLETCQNFEWKSRNLSKLNEWKYEYDNTAENYFTQVTVLRVVVGSYKVLGRNVHKLLVLEGHTAKTAACLGPGVTTCIRQS